MRALADRLLGALVGATAACSFPASGTGADDTDGGDVVDADPSVPDADPATPDAAMAAPDAAPAFDPATDCPADYAPEIFAGGSRYRYMDPLAPENYRTFADSVAACAADAPGLTHLAVPDVAGEAELWMSVINQPAYLSRWTWIGVYRAASSEVWLDVTGGTINPDALPLGPDFPYSLGELDAGLFLRPADQHLRDGLRIAGYHAVCECDGKPSTF